MEEGPDGIIAQRQKNLMLSICLYTDASATGGTSDKIRVQAEMVSSLMMLLGYYR
jgi:hypothetical protein